MHACLPLHGFICCTGVLDCVLANIRKRALCTRLAMPCHNNLSWTKHVIEHRTRFVRQIPKDLFCLSNSVLGKQTLTLTLTLPFLIIPRPILLYKKDPTQQWMYIHTCTLKLSKYYQNVYTVTHCIHLAHELAIDCSSYVFYVQVHVGIILA